jgi:adenylate cyclase
MSATRKLAAILAADVVGYSSLTGADEEGTIARFRALRRELKTPRPHSEDDRRWHLGRVCEFVDAVRCAIAVQRGMARRNTEVSVEKRILFRIGINLGDVVAEGDDLLGDGVNVAARLEGITEPGRICLSRAAYDQARGKIDLAVKDLGEQRLKNIAEPVQVYSVSLNGNASVSFGGGVQGKIPSTSNGEVSGSYRMVRGLRALRQFLLPSPLARYGLPPDRDRRNHLHRCHGFPL